MRSAHQARRIDRLAAIQGRDRFARVEPAVASGPISPWVRLDCGSPDEQDTGPAWPPCRPSGTWWTTFPPRPSDSAS